MSTKFRFSTAASALPATSSLQNPPLNGQIYNNASLRAAQGIQQTDPGSAGDYGLPHDPEYWK
jgi:hypothetical protein